jgi:hypothetical protein
MQNALIRMRAIVTHNQNNVMRSISDHLVAMEDQDREHYGVAIYQDKVMMSFCHQCLRIQ